MTSEQILEEFFEFDIFDLKDSGAPLIYSWALAWGDLGAIWLVDKAGNVLVEQDKRINARHLRQFAEANLKELLVSDEFLIGRFLAKNIIDPETGEVLAEANAEITESLLTALRTAGVKQIETFTLTN